MVNLNIVSGNSTTTALDNGETFTGEWTDVQSWPSVVVAVATDQDGTYSVQYSTDGVNVDSTLTRYYRTAQIEPPHRFTNTRRYCRVTFTNNSGSNQTYLRIQTSVGDRETLNAPLDGTLAQDYDAIVVRTTDEKYEIAKGLRQGSTTWSKWGYNPDIDIGTETVWSQGGSFARMTAADTLDVVSSSTDDDDGGTGAWSIIVYGVDENYETQTEVVVLNGTSAVTTSNSWLGVNRVAIYLAGTGGENAGAITLSRTTGGSVQAHVPATEGSTQQALFFVPSKANFLMDWLLINIAKVGAGTLPVVTTKCFVTSLVSGAKYEVFRHVIDTAIENTVELRPSQPFIVGEKSLVEFQMTTDKDNTVASVRFSGVTVNTVSA